MEGDLFKPISRDERQEEIRIKWIKTGCRGSLVANTGFGKTKVGLDCISCFVAKYPTLRVLVIVPTTLLKDQWTGLLDAVGLSMNCEVTVINTAVKHHYNVDLLLIDEVHRMGSDMFSQIFNVVKYKYILGLTATFERLDGKHALIAKYCPVFDTVTVEEARRNGWISDFKEYKVILHVDDIDEYKTLNKDFQKHFEFFNFQWELVMACVGPKGYITRVKLRDEMCPNGTESERSKTLSEITYHAMAFMKIIQARKAFINNHPKKIEIARKIIDARSDKKIITFSNNIKMAESIDRGKVYSGKDSKKKGRTTMEEFIKADGGTLNSISKCNEGMDIPGLSVAIFLGIDSSKVKKVQRSGRVLRFEKDKTAEIFVLVIDETQENKWASNSNSSSNVVTIDEDGLDDVLAGKEPTPYKRKIKDFTFRF